MKREKSVFITGAATGIGEALALVLDRDGWRVFAAYNTSPPDGLRRKGSPRLTVLPCDVADPAAITRAAREVEMALEGGGLDLLINNAAMTGAAQGPVETLDIDGFHHLMEVNFWATVRTCQAFLPILRRSEKARIMNVTSTSIYLTVPMGCAYPVSKCAQSALTRHLRMELAPFGIEVTALEPGGVRTKMTAFPEEEEETMWTSVPPGTRALYREHFIHPGRAFGERFTFWTPERFAEKVCRIIYRKKWKPGYVVGPGVRALPLMHRFLSAYQREYFFRKLFRVR